MKRTGILQTVAVLAITVILASCGPGRDNHARHYPPRSQNSFSLIIGSSPGLMIMRHPNGMYYYRAPNGFIYWRGYNNRYYLDRRYVNRSYYGHGQYNDWKRYHNYRRHGRR